MFYAYSPLEGLALELCVSPFWPPIPARSPDGYREHLRELWRRSPEVFMHLARTARTQEVTLLSTGRPELLAARYESIVAVARRQGWEIDGGVEGECAYAGKRERAVRAGVSTQVPDGIQDRRKENVMDQTH